MNSDSMPMLGYADFRRLFHVEHSETIDPGLVLREAGVFVATPPSDDPATREERAVLTEHPTGNLSDPALAFPFSIDQLKSFVDFYGLSGAIDAFEMADAVAKKVAKSVQRDAFTAAQLTAQESGNYQWPIVAGLSRLKNEWQHQHDTTRNDSKKVVLRTVLDAVESLLSDPERAQALTAEPSDAETPLRKDTRKNWLRIMRAQLEMMSCAEREVVPDVTQMIESLGFVGPKIDSVRRTFDEARALQPDKPPK